jgi:hypothetical protein
VVEKFPPRARMKKQRRYPEIFVEMDFLTSRPDIVYSVIQLNDSTYRVIFEHPVFGETVEIFEMDRGDNTLCLKSSFPSEMQTEEEMGVVKDYYNNFLLEGEQTYIEYFSKDVGYFLLSRNNGVY